MFTRQIPMLQDARGGSVDSLIDTLAQLLGNCAQDLQHRGTLRIDMNTQPGVPPSDGHAGIYVNNPINYVQGPDDPRAINGWTGYFRGPVNISGNNIHHPILLVINGWAWFHGIYVDDIYDRDGKGFPNPLICGFLSSGVSGFGPHEVSAPEAMFGKPFHSTVEGPLQVGNPFEFEGDEGAFYVAAWRRSAEQYIFIQMTCPGSGSESDA